MPDQSVEPQFYPKQMVEVEVPSGHLKGVYNTKIANLNDQAILLEVPQIGNVFLPIGVGHAFTLRYVEESWAYEMQVAPAARRDNLDTPLMLVTRPKLASRRQIREFTRVETSLETSIHLIKDLKEYSMENPAERQLAQAMMVDISGGGAKLQVSANLDTAGKGYAILWFTLPYIHKSFYNLLTRIKTIVPGQKEKSIIIEFTGLSESEREDIVQYCSRRQMELGTAGKAAPSHG